jgi:hypothetical protein
MKEPGGAVRNEQQAIGKFDDGGGLAVRGRIGDQRLPGAEKLEDGVGIQWDFPDAVGYLEGDTARTRKPRFVGQPGRGATADLLRDVLGR